MSSVQRVAPAGGLHAAPGPAAGGGGGLPRAHGPGHPHPHHHLAPHQVRVTHHRVLLTAHSRVRVSVAAVPPVTVSRPTLTFASLTGTDTLQVGCYLVLSGAELSDYSSSPPAAPRLPGRHPHRGQPRAGPRGHLRQHPGQQSNEIREPQHNYCCVQGVPHCVQKTVQLPLSLVIKPCPPIKDADFKVEYC